MASELFLTGYAKLPQGITATELYKIIAIGVIVDRETGTILDADCTLATKTGRKYIKKLLKDLNVKNIEEIEKKINIGYCGSAKRAIISALRTISEKYRNLEIEEE